MENQDNIHARLTAFGSQLIDVHRRLRSELTRISDEMDDYLDGGARPPAELQAHCLAFCSALERHHTSEEHDAFPALAGQHPGLAAVLDKLREDHRLVSGILRRLEHLIKDLTPRARGNPREARRLRGELDGLTAILESHFPFEERTLTDALSTLRAPAWEATPPAFLHTRPPTPPDTP
ncbi:hemerythrin domain-containing protein [Streptomyces aidingensis]|uniref:Hemerythrin HHE cation binding domain-containing protein n=1 Tax=Streptomyces aidingensis TaxID=910347 RepID=A0A1I1N5E9_9ACTN|nr:hemerythrin domain-containing protein [Streptomyces aidingensis]SFC92556.1 Hemerythrin HHE cation binding domain-containing protein [Streptomyces aidingensis]